jgi:hypothetical protein
MHCTHTPFTSIHLIDTRSEITTLCAHIPTQKEGGIGNEAAGQIKIEFGY